MLDLGIYYWWVVGGLIVIILGSLSVILGLWYRRQRTRADNRARLADLHKTMAKQQQERQQSVNIIAQAMLEDQCDLTEGCIRLTWLIQALDNSLLDHPDYSILKTITDKTQHMPIKEAWQALDKRAKAKFTRERLALEQTHAEAIRQAAKGLRAYQFAEAA